MHRPDLKGAVLLGFALPLYQLRLLSSSFITCNIDSAALNITSMLIQDSRRGAGRKELMSTCFL